MNDKHAKEWKNKLVDIILLRLNETVLKPCQRRTASFDTCSNQGNFFSTAHYELHATEVKFLQRDEMRIATNDIK